MYLREDDDDDGVDSPRFNAHVHIIQQQHFRIISSSIVSWFDSLIFHSSSSLLHAKLSLWTVDGSRLNCYNKVDWSKPTKWEIDAREHNRRERERISSQ